MMSFIFLLFILYNCNIALAQAPPPMAAPATATPASAASGATPVVGQPSVNPLNYDRSGIPMETFNLGSGSGLSRRDPFKLPEYLIIKLRQKNAFSATGLDESADAIRRFPLGSYQLVGIIWDVKKPKAMFMDRVNSIHMLQVNDFIGNARGVIVSIQSGSVTVLEGKIPQIIKFKK